MKKTALFVNIIYSLILCIVVNSYMLLIHNWKLLFLLIPLFLFINIFAGTGIIKSKSKRLKTCYHGALLLSTFAVCLLISVIYHLFLAFHTIPNNHWNFIWSILLCIILHTVVFWNGIICVYSTSLQLGIKQRVIGMICDMIPIANLIALSTIKTVYKEVWFETEDAKNKVASTYNSALKKLGDSSPDFLAAVTDLTAEICTRLDSEMAAPDEIFCQSVGSLLPKARSGKFPFNLSFHLVKYFDGDNDGPVSEKSFKWGENTPYFRQNLNPASRTVI